MEALLAAYQTNQWGLQEDFETYIRQSTFHFTHYELKEKLRGPEVRVRKMRRHEVLYHLADLLLHTRPLQRETVENLLRTAIKKAPSYAEPYRAQALLASLVGRHEEAVPLYEKALSLDPENPRTHSMMGRNLLQQYLSSRGEEETRPATVPTLVLRARGSFEASLDLDPLYYESLVGLGRTFLYGDEDVSVGINALSNASQLLPGRLDPLHHLIVLTARSGNTAGARALYYHSLLPRGESANIRSTEDLLSRAEVEQIRALLASGIDALDRGRVEEALGYVDKTVDISRTSVQFGGAEELTRPLLDQSSAILERILGSQPGEDVRRRAEELLTKVRAR